MAEQPQKPLTVIAVGTTVSIGNPNNNTFIKAKVIEILIKTNQTVVYNCAYWVDHKQVTVWLLEWEILGVCAQEYSTVPVKQQIGFRVSQ